LEWYWDVVFGVVFDLHPAGQMSGCLERNRFSSRLRRGIDIFLL